MTGTQPCRICGEIPYPPTPDGICATCRDASPAEQSQRAALRSVRIREHQERQEREARERAERADIFRDLRGTRPCSCCSHPRLIRYEVHERGTVGSDHTSEVRKPLCVAEHIKTAGIFVVETIPFGPFIAYICEACGFVEWHVAHPEKIPIGPEHHTSIVDSGGSTPYR